MGGVEVPSMRAAAGPTLETEETRIKDRMLKNVIYYRSVMMAKMCRFD
jgi:hypothetical protein